MSLIEMDHIEFSYEKEQPILKGIDFTAEAGESIGLIGANGVGKSTLMKLMVGLCTNYSGTAKIEDISIEKEYLDQIREKIGYVFQDSDSQLFMSNVYEDIAFAPSNYGYEAAEVERRAQDAMEKVHITHLRDKQIYKLSGGEKKLASIATILSMEPEIILMDEPSVALDPKNRRNLIHVLNDLHPMKLIASHDLDFILDTCERTILMDEGRIIKDGPTMEILRDKELLEGHGLELPLRYYSDET